MSLEAADFALDGPLPTGVTVLEASAGTGKTYAIATLAARYVAAGIPLEQMLLVTFTRMATGELRERVRDRLAEVERGLSAAGAGLPPSGDEVVALLASGSPDAVALRCARLRRALADFDAATIATTHSFCQEVLGGLGIAGDLEPDVAFVEDVSDLVEEVVDDVYLSMRRRDRPLFSRAQAGAIARMAIGNPTAPIAAAHDGTAALRVELAESARRELADRKRRRALMDYDDLLTRLDAALAGSDGAAVAARLHDRYRVVLIDEFQDTDPVQWRIVQRAFADTGTTLVLIADPKQAIYAFRGADVYAYLAAQATAGERRTLRVNHRSDESLIDALDALFAGCRLGHPDIVYRTVHAVDPDRPSGLSGAPHPAPLRVRLLDRQDVTVTRGGYASAPAAREYIAADLAADIVGLLGSGATVADPRGGAPVAVVPKHVAVLVGTNRNATLVRDALEDVGVPAVINGAGSVFATDAARDWLAFLEALEQPGSLVRAHAAALTPFFGWSAEAVACAPDERWEEVHGRLHEWGRVLRHAGVAATVETVSREQALAQRILGGLDGERYLTDLRHVAQLLHAAASTEQLGVTALAGWLRQRRADAAADLEDEERSRRLESDADAVQVLTIHRSKGLEFPIVYAPFLWEPGYIPDDPVPVAYHDPELGFERRIDVALEGRDYRRHCELHRDERRGEDLRLAYVALTRARHQVVVWWASAYTARHSPLGRLVFARQEDGTVPPCGTQTPTDAASRAAFDRLAEAARGCVSVEDAVIGPPVTWSSALGPAADLEAAAFTRALDHRWRRTSYSDITAAAHDARVASEPEATMVDDEPDDGAPAAAAEAEAPAGESAPSLWSGFPAGVRAGTLVHRVLEAADFAAADLDAELGRAVDGVPGRGAIADPDGAVAALRAALETPLGPLFGDVRLCDVDRADRLDELGFELPLAGGDTPVATLTVAAIARALREELPEGDPFAAYARRLSDGALRQSVRGYLTGSLDLVVRLPGPRFAVVDYKTNWLAGPDEALTLWHYRPSALVAEMHARHYGLQALLYTVALHRFLRWRVAGYEPEAHIAGVGYLFVRGMAGAATPVVDGARTGVFAWRPPGALVERLSSVLDAGGER